MSHTLLSCPLGYMNKDIMVASIIGFGLGLIGAVALWFVPKMLPKITKPQSSPVPQVNEQVLGENAQMNIEIQNLKDGDVVKDSNLKLNGKSTKCDFLTINTPSDQQIFTSNQEGTFSATLKLNEGGNQIVVSGYNPDSQVSKKLLIYYFADQL